MRNQRFTHLGIDTKAGFNQDYLRTNQQLKNLAETNNTAEYLELDTLEIFKQAPIYKNQITYYDEHHINEIGAKKYAKEAVSIFKIIMKDKI